LDRKSKTTTGKVQTERRGAKVREKKNEFTEKTNCLRGARKGREYC